MASRFRARSSFLVHGPGSKCRVRNLLSLQSSLRRTWNSEPRNQEPLNPRATWNKRGTRNPTWNPEPGIGTAPDPVSEYRGFRRWTCSCPVSARDACTRGGGVWNRSGRRNSPTGGGWSSGIAAVRRCPARARGSVPDPRFCRVTRCAPLNRDRPWALGELLW